MKTHWTFATQKGDWGARQMCATRLPTKSSQKTNHRRVFKYVLVPSTGTYKLDKNSYSKIDNPMDHSQLGKNYLGRILKSKMLIQFP